MYMMACGCYVVAQDWTQLSQETARGVVLCSASFSV